jgi:hypothetical protein
MPSELGDPSCLLTNTYNGTDTEDQIINEQMNDSWIILKRFSLQN